MASSTGRDDSNTWRLLFAAWMIALLATLGALFIGEVMGQKPCVLCWFQRAFMFPLAVMLTIAVYVADAGVWRYALPISLIGWLIALYQSLLYAGIIPEAVEPCGAGPSCSGSDMIIAGAVSIPLYRVP